MNLQPLTRSLTLLILPFGSGDEEEDAPLPPLSSTISLIIHALYTHPLLPARRQKDFLILVDTAGFTILVECLCTKQESSEQEQIFVLGHATSYENF